MPKFEVGDTVKINYSENLKKYPWLSGTGTVTEIGTAGWLIVHWHWEGGKVAEEMSELELEKVSPQ